MFSATKVFMLSFLGMIMLGGVTPIHAIVRNYKFEVMNSQHTRLCTTKTMLTVNGQFPGPTIYARRGDLIIVDIINRADQNITIHGHGVKMPRYPWNDGANMVTQCPIAPGARFRQRMILSDEEGTLWWHAHSDWSRATVHGAIIILPPKNHTFPFPKPHAQVPIILGEWWNGDVQRVMEDFFATGRDGKLSDAFTMNGQPGNLYPCSTQDTYKLRVEFGKTYLIRMVNALLNHIMYFRIANHTVAVVGSDGAYVEPLKIDYVAISPGQTVDFLLEANQPPSHYYMASRVYSKEGNLSPTTGIIEYVGNYTPPSSPPFPRFPDSAESSDFTNQLRRASLPNPNDVVPKNITHKLFMVLSINQWPCDTSRCEAAERLLTSINNVSFLLPASTDVLDAYFRGISGVYTTDFPDFPPSAFDYTHGQKLKDESLVEFGTAAKILEYDSAVEIVFQGTNMGEGIYHPIHLHGHSFYVLGTGFGNFDPTQDPAGYNLLDPPLMETIAVPKNGWATIRFRANNPGVWLLHCHLERHQSWGMRMVFIVKDGGAPNEKMLPPPPDMPHCGGGEPPFIRSSHHQKFNNPDV